MNRRTFLKTLSAIPFVGVLGMKQSVSVIPSKPVYKRPQKPIFEPYTELKNNPNLPDSYKSLLEDYNRSQRNQLNRIKWRKYEKIPGPPPTPLPGSMSYDEWLRS